MRQGREARRAGVGHLRNALSEAGDTNYQERTSTMLGQLSEHTLRRWGGDLRKLRDEAERDPKRERKLLKEVKGLDDVGVASSSARGQGAGTSSCHSRTTARSTRLDA
jgi:hypothetical protein